MKIKKLTINNIASIADATIDFDASPLKGEPLFLICGATGAGKSTILDAICLALYGTTPRMKMARNEDFTPAGTNEAVKLQNPAQMLRHGASSGSVTLTFVGNDSNPYEAKWSVKMKRTSNLDTAVWRLKNLSTGITLEKKREIEEEMQRILGAGFSDFMKTTMLAQGDFAQFLKSDADEKANILQSLSGNDIYERIGKKIFEIHRDKEDAKKNMQIEVNALHLLSDEEVTSKKNRRNAAQTESEDTSARLKEMQTKADWKEKQAAILGPLDKKKAKLRELTDTIEGEQFRSEEKTIDLWRTTAEARSWTTTLHSKRIQLATERRNEEDLQYRFGRACAGLAGLQRSISENDSRLAAVTQSIDECPEKERAMILKSDAIADKLKTARRMMDQATATTEEMRQSEEKQPSLQAKLEKTESDLSEAKRIETEAQTKVNETDEKIQRLDPHNNLTNLNRLWLELLSNLRGIKNKHENLQKAKSEETEAKRQLEEERNKLNSLLSTAEEAKKAFEQADTVYKTAAKAVNDMAKELRHGLHEGDSCPVCGQTINTLLSDEHFQSVLAAPEREREQREEAMRRANADLSASKRLASNYEEALKKCGQTVTKEEAEVENAIAKCADIYAQLSESHKAEALSSLPSLEVEIENAETISKSLKKKIERLDELQKEKNSLQKEKDGRSKETEEKKRASEAAKKALDDLRNEVEKLKTKRDENEGEGKKLLSELDNMVAIADWRGRFASDCLSLIETIQKAAADYNRWDSEKTQLEKAIKDEKEELSRVEDITQQITELTSWKSPAVQPEKVERLSQASTKLLNDTSKWHTTIERLTTDVTELEAKLQQFLSAHPDLTEEAINRLKDNFSEEKISQTATKHKQQTTEQTGIKSECDLLCKQLSELEETAPAFGEEEKTRDAASFRSEATELARKRDELNQTIGSLDNELKQNKHSAEEVMKKRFDLERLTTEADRWYRLKNLLGDANGKRFKQLALQLVFDHLLQNANRYLRHFDDNFELAKQGGFVIEVKDYRSNRNLSSTSLSGGQQFMVSLALALGLADMADNSRCASDTIFIDEGFGTLSDEYLGNVMECLEKLHQTTGKRVGIISHVVRLRERIPTQIVVEGGNSSAASRVSVAGIS